jgi:hypothetical protein
LEVRARIELKQGTHVADRDRITVAEAGKLWIVTCAANELECAATTTVSRWSTRKTSS